MDQFSKEKVKEQFGKNAQKYVESVSHSQSEDLDLLVDWIKPNTDCALLDIATGGGHVAKKMAPHVKTIFATDLTKKMLETTKKFLKDYKNIHFVIADAENLPFLDNTFDVVVCRIAAHHFPDPSTFISEVSRVLITGGKFILIDNVIPENEDLGKFMNTFEKLRDDSHVKCLSVSKWLNLFKKNNLQVERSRMRQKTFDFSVWVERTTENQRQARKVHDYIIGAKQELKEYFQVKEKNGEIQKFSIDECMIMCERV